MCIYNTCIYMYSVLKQTLNPTSLNLPLFRLHNPSSSQDFLSLSCSLHFVVLLWLVSAPHLKGGVQTSAQFPGEPSPVLSRAQRITACFLWALGNLGWVLTWLFHFQFQNCLIGLGVSDRGRGGKIPSAFWKSFHGSERRKDLGPELSKSYGQYP